MKTSLGTKINSENIAVRSYAHARLRAIGFIGGTVVWAIGSEADKRTPARPL